MGEVKRRFLWAPDTNLKIPLIDDVAIDKTQRVGIRDEQSYNNKFVWFFFADSKDIFASIVSNGSAESVQIIPALGSEIW